MVRFQDMGKCRTNFVRSVSRIHEAAGELMIFNRFKNKLMIDIYRVLRSSIIFNSCLAKNDISTIAKHFQVRIMLEALVWFCTPPVDSKSPLAHLERPKFLLLPWWAWIPKTLEPKLCAMLGSERNARTMVPQESRTKDTKPQKCLKNFGREFLNF